MKEKLIEKIGKGKFTVYEICGLKIKKTKAEIRSENENTACFYMAGSFFFINKELLKKSRCGLIYLNEKDAERCLKRKATRIIKACREMIKECEEILEKK